MFGIPYIVPSLQVYSWYARHLCFANYHRQAGQPFTIVLTATAIGHTDT